MQPSPLVITEINASSGDSDINVQQRSANFHPSSPHSRDIRSPLELAAASDHADSPAISSIYLDLESRPKSSGIDVNARPANVPDFDVPNEPVEETTTQALPTGGVQGAQPGPVLDWMHRLRIAIYAAREFKYGSREYIELKFAFNTS
ncbi:hypothetical protein ACET3Z_030906 [Daucus carota]